MRFQDSFDPAAGNHTHGNAYWLGKAAELAYLDNARFEAAVGDWGVKCRHVSVKGTEGHVAAGKAMMIVAFRGTETNPGDIATDARFKQTRWAGPGQVHEGFSQALDRAWNDTVSAIGAISQPGHTLWFTGHSLGGALAVLAAMRWTTESRKPAVTAVYTIGQPKVGDGEFSGAFDRALGKRTFRYVNNRDPVPRVPIVGYKDVGKVFRFDDRGRLESRSGFWLRTVTEVFTSGTKVMAALKSAVGDHAAAKYVEHLKRAAESAR